MTGLEAEHKRLWEGVTKPTVALSETQKYLRVNRELHAEYGRLMGEAIARRIENPRLIVLPPLPWHRRLKRAIYRWLIRFSDDGED